jgi:L-2,4-diaminobutyrate transaminase
MFGCETYGIEPDLITIAKGLTSAYVPMSACLVGERVFEVMKRGSDLAGAFSHGYTYSGHPVAAAAANAVLDLVEQEDLPGNAARTGAYFQERLRDSFGDHPLVGEVRGVGLMAAVEFVADRAARRRFDPALKVGPRISAAALERGLIARAMPHGDILGFSPPLVIRRAEIDMTVERARQAVDHVSTQLQAEGRWRP